MNFRQYYFGLDKPERANFARAVESTEGHLNNVAYGYRLPATDLAVSIERESIGQVRREEMRPGDYWRHWPELAPALTPQAQAAINSEASHAAA